MSDNNQPVLPPATGNERVDALARRDHFNSLTTWFEKNGARPATPSPVQQPPTPAEAQTRAQEFDREMREKGLQRNDTYSPGEIDQRALQHLQNLQKTTPAAERTTAWLGMWERDYASVLEGRRWGESPEQFTARKAGIATTAKPAAEEPAGVASDHFTVEQHGYTLPPCPEGVEVDQAAAESMLAVARAAGIPQAAVDAYFNQLAKQV